METFTEARGLLVASLRAGDFLADAREDLSRNLLATGDVSPEDVALLLLACRGDQHERSPHHRDRSVTVHVFRPTAGRERWYIKAFIAKATAEGGRPGVFISVHPRDPGPRGGRR